MLSLLFAVIFWMLQDNQQNQVILTIDVEGPEVVLQWDDMIDPNNPVYVEYLVWRGEGSCSDSSLQFTSLTGDDGMTATGFVDDTVKHGMTYCFMVSDRYGPGFDESVSAKVQAVVP